MLHDLEPDGSSGGRPGRRLTLYDILALGIAVLTVVVLGWLFLIFRDPYSAVNPFPPPLPPTRVTIVPYQTPTWITQPPTRTPTPTWTLTPPYTLTPPPTATVTLTPTPQWTPTPVNTPSAFLFTLEGDAVSYRANENGQECDWQSIAGSVTGLDGEPLAEALYVQIKGEDVDEVVLTGSAPFFGPSGYELQLGTSPARGQYTVQLLNQSGAEVSDIIQVDMIDRCEQNVAVVNFLQNREE